MDFKWEGQTKWKCSVNKNKLVIFYFDILWKINVHYQIKLIAKIQQIHRCKKWRCFPTYPALAVVKSFKRGWYIIDLISKGNWCFLSSDKLIELYQHCIQSLRFLPEIFAKVLAYLLRYRTFQSWKKASLSIFYRLIL